MTRERGRANARSAGRVSRSRCAFTVRRVRQRREQRGVDLLRLSGRTHCWCTASRRGDGCAAARKKTRKRPRSSSLSVMTAVALALLPSRQSRRRGSVTWLRRSQCSRRTCCRSRRRVVAGRGRVPRRPARWRARSWRSPMPALAVWASVASESCGPRDCSSPFDVVRRVRQASQDLAEMPQSLRRARRPVGYRPPTICIDVLARPIE